MVDKLWMILIHGTVQFVHFVTVPKHSSVWCVMYAKEPLPGSHESIRRWWQNKWPDSKNRSNNKCWNRLSNRKTDPPRVTRQNLSAATTTATAAWPAPPAVAPAVPQWPIPIAQMTSILWIILPTLHRSLVNTWAGLNPLFNLLNSNFVDKITSSNKSNTACSSATTKSPTPSSSRNSFKMNSSSANNSFENEVDENSEIDSTSNGTTCNGSKPAPVVRKVKTIGPRAKLKNVDRTDVIVRSVTVNNVTVLITEFKPKRKFTEVSDNLKAESPNKKAKDSPTKIKDGAKPKTSAVTPTVDAKKAKCAKTEEKKKRQSSSDTPIEHNNSFSKKIPSD